MHNKIWRCTYKKKPKLLFNYIKFLVKVFAESLLKAYEKGINKEKFLNKTKKDKREKENVKKQG